MKRWMDVVADPDVLADIENEAMADWNATVAEIKTAMETLEKEVADERDRVLCGRQTEGERETETCADA